MVSSSYLAFYAHRTHITLLFMDFVLVEQSSVCKCGWNNILLPFDMY